MGTFLDSLAKSTVETALHISEVVLLISGAVLLIGIWGEYRKDDKWRKHLAIFEIMVLLGVGAELIGDAGVFIFSESLQRLEGADIQALDTKAGIASGKATDAVNKSGDAERSSATALGLAESARQEADSFKRDVVSAKTQAADAESHLADALERAADADQEALKVTRELVKLKTPRSLSADQQERIKSKIKLFPEIPFDLWVSDDSDSTALMEVIDADLRSAGWKFMSTGTPIEFDNKAGIIASSGVSIHVPEERRSEWEAAILALSKALVAEGLPTTPMSDTAEGEKDKKRDRIRIMIGSKPLN